MFFRTKGKINGMLYFNNPHMVATTISQRYGLTWDRNFFNAGFIKKFGMVSVVACKNSLINFIETL